jgi:soluble cytochrome b562
MKAKTFLTLATALVFSLGSAAFAADDSPLLKEMKSINKNLRTLKKQVADPAKKDDNLQLLSTIRKSTQAAHDMDPDYIKDKPNKADLSKEYKKQMKELDVAFEEVEKAVKDGKGDEAKAAMEKLSKLKEKGHKDFGVDEE